MNFRHTFKTIYLLSISLLLVSSCQDTQKKQAQTPQTDDYNEQYRPQFHFSPAENWMNDPNGLVYKEGEYHLFYQHNPFGNKWGHMSWGHAVSTDLTHWKHLPVALKEENNVMIFSGSAVVDHQNTSGFGSKENPPMVAIYTGHHTDQELQDQRIAYSLDDGRSWAKYKKNPVLDEGMKNFRDPKVFWHDDSRQWVMVVALPTEYKVRFYGSENLKDWELLSEFGPSGNTDGIWECPDLFKLPVDGNPNSTKWVLQVDTNPGGPFGGSGAQYFLGEFDGATFTQDQDTKGNIRWVDYGKDFYAVQSYANIPESDGRRIWISWMNNWQYAQEIPTDPWRSAMTIPRSLQLKSFDDGIHLVHSPVKELQKIRGKHVHLENKTPENASEILREEELNGNLLEIKVRLNINGAASVGLQVAKGANEETVVGYNAQDGYLYVDRSKSGKSDFSEHFEGVHKAPMTADNGEITMHVFVDQSSVEVFGNDGRVVITDRIFPSPDSNGISLFSTGGTANIVSLDVWQLQSTWNNIQQTN